MITQLIRRALPTLTLAVVLPLLATTAPSKAGTPAGEAGHR
ncbi:hypothetical protein [Streptomyces sp. RKAG293]|nr:hypothetical protein [Streptomyces sp. RKAG293]